MGRGRAAAPPWAYLPPELLELIFMRLDNCLDFLHCQGVCTTWSSISKEVYRQLFTYLPPLIMFTRTSLSSSSDAQSSTLYSTQSKSESSLSLPIKRCQINGSVSCNNWLLVSSTTTPGKIHLINMASLELVDLPRLTLFQINWRLNNIQIITSSDPLDSNCIFYLVDPDRASTFSRYSWDESCVAICKKGDTNWTYIPTSAIDSECCIVAAQYNISKGFMFVNEMATMYSSSCRDLNEWEAYYNFEDIKQFEDNTRYLVESSGDILLVLQILERNCFPDVQFEVYKMDMDKIGWIPLPDLGDRSVFLSQGHSMSIDIPSITTSSHYSGCRSNCIYFIIFGVVRVYDMKLGKSRTLCKLNTVPGSETGAFAWVKPVTL